MVSLWKFLRCGNLPVGEIAESAKMEGRKLFEVRLCGFIFD